MSKLILTGHNGARFELSVTQFRSPMSAQINTVQTRYMQQHFPIRAGQPDIQFTVHFSSVDDKHDFQTFVRDHQRNAQKALFEESGTVSLMWPERNIIDWSGYIVSMPVREARFEYAPKVTFGVSLVESLMTKRTFIGSYGSGFGSVIGPQIPEYQDSFSPELSLTPPTPPAAEEPDPGSEERGLIGSIFSTIGGLFR